MNVRRVVSQKLSELKASEASALEDVFMSVFFGALQDTLSDHYR